MGIPQKRITLAQPLPDELTQAFDKLVFQTLYSEGVKKPVRMIEKDFNDAETDIGCQ